MHTQINKCQQNSNCNKGLISFSVGGSQTFLETELLGILALDCWDLHPGYGTLNESLTFSKVMKPWERLGNGQEKWLGVLDAPDRRAHV